MFTRHLKILVPAVAAVVLLVGCSGEQLLAPSGKSLPSVSADKSAVPADLVVALDVSDAVSDETLAAMVAGLGAALGNADIVPHDGRITMAVVAYGDTIATPLPGAVPVTAENLQNTIIPALEGLVAARPVTGATADMGRALDHAALLLTAAISGSEHVLVSGSGAASDTSAAQTAGTALVDAGVMVSAAFAGEGDVLMPCVAAGGGWLDDQITDWDTAMADALGYMLHVELTLDGSADELDRGEEFTATATFFRGLDPAAHPLVGADVVFAVAEGPQAGVADTVTVDPAGHALFAYTGAGGSGTDVVLAQAVHPGTGSALTDTVRITWRNIAPVCDAGGPYTAVIQSDTVRVNLDATGSSDAEGDTLTFTWSVSCDGAVLDDPTAAQPVLTVTGACLCVDSLLVDLVVDDGSATSACQAVVTFDDHRPPVVEVRDDPLVLWPPNHKYAEFTADMFIESAEDACGNPLDLDQVTVLEVRSDEPDDDRGDGRTVDDMRVSCPDVVHLRAERMGGGDGRVYTIVYRVTVDNGESVDVQGRVVVPHDNSGRNVGEDMAGGWILTPDCGN